MTRRRVLQSGFTIVAAIFLVVILALLGAFMVSLSGTQHITSAQDVQGTRAYWAARAGLEWALPQIKATNACPVGSPGTVEGFAVSVSCVANVYTEGATTRTILRVESTASAGGAVGSIAYVERKVSAFVEF